MIVDPSIPMLDIALLERGAAAAKAVARLHVETMERSGTATAFLISRTTVLTAYHVLFDTDAGTPRDVQGAAVMFDYAAGIDGKPLAAVERFAHVGTLVGDPLHNWAAIGLDTPAPKRFPVLSLGATAPPKIGDAAYIIQHPNGGLKKVVLGSSAIKFVDDTVIRYTTNTMPGSSGAPVFNDRWQVIGLHFRSDRTTLLNEGTRIEQVLRGLREKGLAFGADEAAVPCIYVSACIEDQGIVEKLEIYLTPLIRAGKLSLWHRGKAAPGTNVADAAERQLRASDVVLLVISADYLRSDETMAEASSALRGKGRVVPILARPSLWEATPFHALQWLPRDGQPLMRPVGLEEAFVSAAKAIGTILTYQEL